jgi:hypothetical protein
MAGYHKLRRASVGRHVACLGARLLRSALDRERKHGLDYELTFFLRGGPLVVSHVHNRRKEATLAHASNRLQPFHVFKAEATRINELYWLTRYSNRRTVAVLEVLGRLGSAAPDPTAVELWPSTEDGERRHVTISLSTLGESLDRNLATLRLTTVLYLCSAFELALSAYYVLAALYRPEAILPEWTHGSCPTLAGDLSRLDDLKANAAKQLHADPKKGNGLKGLYSKRLAKLNSLFDLKLEPVATVRANRLDTYYQLRHRIAHTQGLQAEADPSVAPSAVLAALGSVSEPEWKAMLKDFMATVTEVDVAMRSRVARDHGLAPVIASVVAELRRGGTETSLGELRYRISSQWHLSVSESDIATTLAAMRIVPAGVGKISRRIIR